MEVRNTKEGRANKVEALYDTQKIQIYLYLINQFECSTLQEYPLYLKTAINI
jgi:hypothetical protein